MNKRIAASLAALLTCTTVGVANATEYSFPTGMTVSIERDKVPVYKEGSNIAYSVVNYFTVLMPNGDQSFALRNEAGDELPVAKEGDRYFIDADLPSGEVIYFGSDTETVATPVRVMLQGPIKVGHVHFASASTKLSAEAKQALRFMAQEMAAANLTSAYLVGSTDRAGSNDANLTLAQKRANVASAYLQKQLSALGVARSVVSTETMGEYLSTRKDGSVNPYDRKVSVLIYPTV